jgi:hypothetical protein
VKDQIAYILTIVLAAGDIASACTPPSAPAITSQRISAQDSSVTQPPPGYFVSATVHEINRVTGRVTLKTEVGTFFALVSPKDLLKLHEGDVIVVYMTGAHKRPTIRT